MIATAALSKIGRVRCAKWCKRCARRCRRACRCWCGSQRPIGWKAAGTSTNPLRLAAQLKPLGVDLIDCSSGGAVPKAVIPAGPGFQVPFAERIRKETGILTAAVGMITESQQAQGIIQCERADMVFLARELLRDPYWPLHAAHKLQHDVAWPKQYLRAKPS